MKKCPFCAEEIQDEAIKCKYCKSDLDIKDFVARDSFKSNKEKISKSKNEPKSPRRLFFENLMWIDVIIGLIALLVAFSARVNTILCFIFLCPLILIMLIKPRILLRYGRGKIKTEEAGIFIILVFFLLLCLIVHFLMKSPNITILEPKDGDIIENSIATIKGTATKGSTINFDSRSAFIANDNDQFVFRVDLEEGENKLKITAKNSFTGKRAMSIFTLNRVLSAEEKQAQEAIQKAKEEEIRQEAAKKAAEEAAFNNSKAGKLCKAHPDWTKDDCINLADRKIWIGMTYEMLVSLFGKPNHINVSNYGNGNQYQWCWDNWKPSYFYGGEDGIVTAYN